MTGTEMDGDALQSAISAIPSSPGGAAGPDDTSGAQSTTARDLLCITMHTCEYLEPDQIDAILADREFFLPWLRAALRRRIDSGHMPEEDGAIDMADFHAMFLLAHLGDTASLPDILACFTASDETLHDFYGDALIEDFWQPIARLAPDAFDVVLDFLATTTLAPVARAVIIHGLLALAVLRQDHRAAVAAYITRIVEEHALPAGELADMLYACGEFDIHELRDAAFAFADAVEQDAGAEDVGNIGMEEIRESFTGAMHDDARQRLHDTVYTLNQRWEAWYRSISEENWLDSPALLDKFGAPDDEQPMLPIRSEPKIGRNAPCPCGSGKKFKKCCWKS